MRAGVLAVETGEIQTPDNTVWVDGIAVVKKGWQRGHFWLRGYDLGSESPNGMTITGHWNCW